MVEISAPATMPTLPAAVEVAAYRIAVEALANAARHAGARRCDVRFVVGDGLTVEILDDGCGLPPDYRVGVGISSMRERAGELGGRCEIDAPSGGGTRVRAWLPIGPGLTDPVVADPASR